MMKEIRTGAVLQRYPDSRQTGVRQATNASGFSLVELMVAVAILTIVLTIAMPDMKNAVRSYQLTARANNIVNVLNHARSEAAKRGLRVTVCSSTDGASCAGSNQNNWHQGWIMFVDSDNDAAVSTGEVIVQNAPADTEFTMVLSGTTNYLSFVSSGMPKTSGFSWWSGSIDIRRVGDSGSDPGRRVTISRAGSMRVNQI
ncbi:MAG: GspH/FimT family pseudopilin [Mariprofundaceae bacterium]|nr:GspH/FimT family pseudopilin [Mariprofundaceae bacterium]